MKAFSNDNYSFPTQNTCIIRMAHRLIQSYLSLFLAGLVMTPLATASDAKVTKITWQNL